MILNEPANAETNLFAVPDAARCCAIGACCQLALMTKSREFYCAKLRNAFSCAIHESYNVYVDRISYADCTRVCLPYESEVRTSGLALWRSGRCLYCRSRRLYLDSEL